MRLSAPQEAAEPAHTHRWMEDWYWDGKVAAGMSNWSRSSCEDTAKGLHRKLRALRSMSDEQYIQMRKRRCYIERELEPREIDGILRSARAIEVWMARSELHSLESRLASVVRALPQMHGYAVDQDHFNLRSYGRWWVNWRFASYVSLEKRLRVFKEMRSIQRSHEERRRKQRRAERRAERYPELLRQLRELKARVT